MNAALTCRGEPDVMPTSTLPPDAPDRSTAHHVEATRDGDGTSMGCAAPPPEVLLPSGGPDHRGVLEAGVWGDAAFRRQVDAIRVQLGPVRSRVALASAYGREAARQRVESLPATVDGRRVATCDRETPLQIAYALRWLELADPASDAVVWADLLDGPLD
jgi:hypothetical protein